MNNDYISTEVRTILNTQKDNKYEAQALASAWILGNLKGINLKILNVAGTSSLADYFILASATNTTQAKSMADTLLKQFKINGVEAISSEGLDDAQWILIDLGDILVHIFQESSRTLYDLDHLFISAPRVDIPSSYYFSEDAAAQAPEDSKSFF